MGSQLVWTELGFPTGRLPSDNLLFKRGLNSDESPHLGIMRMCIRTGCPCRGHSLQNSWKQRPASGWGFPRMSLCAFISCSTLESWDAELGLQRSVPRNTGCQMSSGSLRAWAINPQPLPLTGTSPWPQKSWICAWLSCCAHVEPSQHHSMCCVWADGSALQPGRRWHWVMPCPGSDCQKFVISLIITL